jgi:hypothetical protein
MNTTPITTDDVQTRITECLTRAVRIFRDENQTSVVRAVAEAYLYTLCKERIRFLRAALHYLRSLEIELPEAGRFSLTELIIRPPARWEFEHVDVFGTVSDALCCADRYRTCARFVAVHPVEPGDPLICPQEPMRVPLRHKPTSPWFRALMRRLQLKHELGPRCRALVSCARVMTKTEFLEQFGAKPGEQITMTDRRGRPYTLSRRIPDIPLHRLLARTGYTPEEFWREVRKPYTVPPHRPQLQLL